ncbi:MAG: COX15/CtaA family protein [Elusimicrobia bacterium]|nr:COX15/CtaA family protein [Elusimicrobiota bacterium]
MLPPNKPVAVWLFTCCAFVALVLATGGITRLTHSGLSIVEWKPVTGVVLPLSETGWEQEFAKYRGTPEWRERNADMTIGGFKRICWLEWLHRLLGRLAGLAFVLPLAYYWRAGRIDPRLAPRLLAIAGLWALQGLVGWLMVASGLVSIPRVSPYRLTLHLMTAALLYAAMFWTALELWSPGPAEAGRPKLGGRWLLALGVVTLASGGFVAGLKAGYLYNTFPTMMGAWLPPRLLDLTPLVRNFFENELTVQFQHRLLGLALLAAVIESWWRTRSNLLLAVVSLQVALGIATLLLHMPVAVAVLHQVNSLAVLSALLLVRRDLRSA